MKTSEQWWKEVSSSEDLLNAWLRKQYHGEMQAYNRIRMYTNANANILPAKTVNLLRKIGEQERDHAEWVGNLLKTRGIEPAMLVQHNEAYWNNTLPTEPLEASIEQMSAVAAHAEHMRLERIRVIAADEKAPADIHAVFQRILPDETFHEQAFTFLTSEEHLAAALAAHQAGTEAIGLIQISEVL